MIEVLRIENLALVESVELDVDIRPDARPESDRLRDYGLGAQILADLGVHRMRLLTNRPRPIVGIEAFDLSVEEIVPLDADVPTARSHSDGSGSRA